MDFNDFRERSWKDTWCFWLNMVPLGLSAFVRALFWSLGIPFSICRQTYVKSKWDDDFLTILPASSKHVESDEALKWPLLIPLILEELKSRNAHHFPHAGARRFTEHIVGEICSSPFGFLVELILSKVSLGVANLLKQWKQPPTICVAGLLHSIYSTEMFPWVPLPFLRSSWNEEFHNTYPRYHY
jgi:hypothetical protein